MQQTLLVELFTEELPPKALQKLGDAFAHSLRDAIVRAGLAAAATPMTVFASPRRLAAAIENVRAVGADQPFIEKLMPVAVGLDKDGNATSALTKKLAAKSLAHIDIATLERENDGKAEQLIYRGTAKGQTLQAGLQAALNDAIRSLPVPKVMSYQLADGATTVQFVRPAHALVALHGAEVVNIDALGLTAGRVTHGHRFQGAADITLNHADEYAARLASEGGVIASFDARKTEIEKLLLAAAHTHAGSLGARETYVDLLDEVTALVEHPTVYAGTFDAEFLRVPAECLILTMKLNQKYFPLFDASGKLSNRFLIVSNMRLDDPKNVIEGNERVVRPRLSDARFFFETDQKTKLEARVPKLASVVYHNKLGTQGERVERVKNLAMHIAQLIGADAALAGRAAQLAKADLLTDMVGEFPELQGTMGRYYALHDGESPIVADAIAQHYQPRFSGDALPDSTVALAVALADKLETLAGLFSIGQIPTGDKDPFALRRHALGVLRMLIERALPLDVDTLVSGALAAFPRALPDAAPQLTTYIFDRLSGYLRDLGYSALEVDAAVTARPPWGEFPTRLAAIREFLALPEAASLAAANKRIGNILKKSDAAETNVDAALLVEPAERALHAALQASAPTFDAAFAAQQFTAALKSLAPLKVPVDAFFDGVMVNAEDAKLRANRLALLRDLHVMMNKVADLSKLAA